MIRQIRILFSLLGIQAPPTGDAENGNKGTIELDALWGNGTGDDSAEAIFFDGSRDLAASTSEDIDLATALDIQGQALALAEVRILCIQTPETNQGTIRMQPSAADGWTSYLNADPGGTDTPYLNFPPGTTKFVAVGPDGAYAVGGGNDSINFENLDGANPNTYALFIAGPRS